MKETNSPAPVVPPALDNERDMFAEIGQRRSVLDECMEPECTRLFSAHACATLSRGACDVHAKDFSCLALFCYA